jgi:hypothetical protein
LDDAKDALCLTGEPHRPVVTGADAEAQWPAYVVRHAHKNASGQDGWLLLTSGQIRVSINGDRLDLGIRALRDKDEIRANESTMLFSNDQLARVLLFPGIGRPCKCPRCQLEIEIGSPAVRCPSCGIYHHQSEDSPCWTYAEKCTICGRSTSLGEGSLWTPEGL